MAKIVFTKMVATGNDFVLIDNRHQGAIDSQNLGKLARKICDRKFGIGADGLLFLGKSRSAQVRMRIFNADGSEAEMCGNGARCVALFVVRRASCLPAGKAGFVRKTKLKIETKAGIIPAEVNGDNVKIRLTDPKGIRLDMPLRVNGRVIRISFVNTGVPHAVIFCAQLDKLSIFEMGRAVRFHEKFAPAGANVNFVEVLKQDSIKIRTYERGVEDETLACGTGSTAAAIIFSLKTNFSGKVNVVTKSKEVLKVHFRKEGKRLEDVWLEGKAGIVYKGEYLNV